MQNESIVLKLKNKTMKKLLMIVLGGCFFAMNANAQMKRNAHPSQKVMSDSTHWKKGKMMNDLNLTPAQKTQMQELHKSINAQREAIKNDASLTQDQRKEKMKELRKTQMEKMNSILTPEQQAQKKAQMQKMKENKKGHGNMHKNKNGKHHGTTTSAEKTNS